MNKHKPAAIGAIFAVIVAISGATVSVHAADIYWHDGTHTIECIDLKIWKKCWVKPHAPHPPGK